MNVMVSKFYTVHSSKAALIPPARILLLLLLLLLLLMLQVSGTAGSSRSGDHERRSFKAETAQVSRLVAAPGLSCVQVTSVCSGRDEEE